MVAVLLRLRFRVLANTLQRNPLQLVAVIVGAAVVAMLVAVSWAAMLLVSALTAEVAQAVVVVGGAALVLGWVVVPLLFDGVDRTLDPLKLAPYPLGTGTLMTAMFLVGVAWVPGIATIAVSVGIAIAWRGHPASAALAVLAGLVGAATCVVGARLTTTVAGSLLRGRGAARVALTALALLVLAIPFALATVNGVAAGAGLARVTSAVETLAWSPFGAVWSIPGRVALGDFAGAVAAAAIAVVTLGVLLALWRLALGASLRVRGDRPPRAAGARRLGALGWVPATPAGAVFARSLIYWFRDARQSRQLLLLPILPVLMLLWWRLFGLEVLALTIGPITAALLPLSAFATLSYDGTAFAAELVAGVRGLHDRLGRALAIAGIATPAIVVVQVAIAVVIGRMPDLPALLGLSLGILLISLGVISVSSARFVVPVTRSGRNPFSAQAGAATTSIFASYAVAIATIVLAVPLLALAVVALVAGSPVLGWVTLVFGLGTGVAVLWGGVVLGGRLLDASGPEMLSRLRLIRA